MPSVNSVTDENKSIVSRFISDVWNARQFDKLPEFVAAEYLQHNPNLADGRDALEAFLRGYYSEKMAGGEFQVVRLVAEGDLVMAHSLFRMSQADRGTAVVDIYRVRAGLLVEHWDVKEAVPEHSTNGNPIV